MAHMASSLIKGARSSIGARIADAVAGPTCFHKTWESICCHKSWLTQNHFSSTVTWVGIYPFVIEVSFSFYLSYMIINDVLFSSV